MKKVLFVEDEALLQDAYEARFKGLYEVHCVGDGQSARKSLQESMFDLIVLDIMLPGNMNGFDILREIKNSDRLKAIPVIVFTNLAGEEKTASDMGAVQCLIKSDTRLEDLENSIFQYI